MPSPRRKQERLHGARMAVRRLCAAGVPDLERRRSTSVELVGTAQHRQAHRVPGGDAVAGAPRPRRGPAPARRSRLVGQLAHQRRAARGRCRVRRRRRRPAGSLSILASGATTTGAPASPAMHVSRRVRTGAPGAPRHRPRAAARARRRRAAPAPCRRASPRTPRRARRRAPRRPRRPRRR